MVTMRESLIKSLAHNLIKHKRKNDGNAKRGYFKQILEDVNKDAQCCGIKSYDVYNKERQILKRIREGNVSNKATD